MITKNIFLILVLMINTVGATEITSDDVVNDAFNEINIDSGVDVYSIPSGIPKEIKERITNRNLIGIPERSMMGQISKSGRPNIFDRKISNQRMMGMSNETAFNQNIASSYGVSTTSGTDTSFDISGNVDILWEKYNDIIDNKSYTIDSYQHFVTDLDGDDKPDVIISEYNNSDNLYNFSLKALKGKDGTQLWSKLFTNVNYVDFIPIDLNGDRTNEVLLWVQSYNNSDDTYTYSVIAVKGKDGNELWNRSVTGTNVGLYPDRIVDLTGDKTNDVLLQSQSYNSSNNTWTYSVIAVKGQDGNELWNRSVTGKNVEFYTYNFGDLTGDGTYDLLLWSNSINNSDSTYSVIAVKGPDGVELWNRSMTGTNIYLYPNGIADLNGDRTYDVLLRSYSTNNSDSTYSVIAVKGQDGIELWNRSMTGTNIYLYPYRVADLNGDSTNEVLLRSYSTNNSDSTYSVIAVKGPDGVELWNKSITGENIGLYPYTVADLNGDRTNEVLLQSYSTNNSDSTYSVIAVKGPDGVELWNRSMTGTNIYLYPYTVVDLNGDRTNEVLLRSYSTNNFNSTYSVIAVKGPDGVELWNRSITGRNIYLYPYRIADLTGDSINDVILRSMNYSNNTYSVIAVKGSNGNELWTRSMSGINIQIFYSLLNWDGDNQIDVLIEFQSQITSNWTSDFEVIKGNNGLSLWTGHTDSRAVFETGNFDLNGDGKHDVLIFIPDAVYALTIDFTQPSVTDLSLSKTTPRINDPVNITVNVTDINLNTTGVFVDVKHPGGYSFRSLMNGSEPNYYFNYTNTSEYGRYNVTIIASDEAGNINNTQKTWFVTIKTSSAPFNEENGEIADGSWEWNSSNFPDFVHNENLKSNVDIDNRTIPEGGLWYNTSIDLIPFKVFEATGKKVKYGLNEIGISWAEGGGYYAEIGWMGESSIGIKEKSNKHSKILLEQNISETKNLTTGEVWNLRNGYSLKFNYSDPNAYPVIIGLTLFKNNLQLNNTIIKEGDVYSYDGTMAGEYNVPLFVTYLDNVSTSIDPVTHKISVDYITLKYTWLISDSVTEILRNDTFGRMKVQNVNWYLNLSNYENITLDRGESLNIINDLYFRVLDTEDLSYYPFFNIPEARTTDMFDNDLSMEISLNESISGTINVTQMSDVPPDMNPISRFKSLNKFIDIDVSDDINNTLEWVKIKIYYTQAELDASGVTEANLKILWYNGSVWQDVTGGYNSTDIVTDKGIYTGHVWTNMSHLSTFALAGYIPPSSGGGNPPSSGGGSSTSGGGGGGGGVSGENFSNIILKENYDLTISKDITTSYWFKSAGNPVTVVNITGNVSAGLINTAVEVLKGTSTLVKEAAPGKVYKNVNIWVGTSGFATSKNIKEAIVVFRVENSWFDSNVIARSDIKLVKWDGAKWITLETSEKIRDSAYTYFEGKTTSFSPFAITGLGISSTSPSEATPTQTAQAGTPEAGAATTGGTTPPINLFSIIGVIAILVIIAAVYLKYKK